MQNTNTTAGLRLVTVADLKASDTTSITVTFDPDGLAVVLDIQRSDDTVHLQLVDDDTAHRLGIALIEAARQLTTYGLDD